MYPRTGEPLVLIGIWAQVDHSKGGQTDEVQKSQASARKSLVRQAREGSAKERWRLEGGGTVQVDGRSTPGRVGGEKRVKRESEAASKGGIRGSNR